MKSRPAWSKLSSAQLSTATPCAGSPYQLLRSNGNSAVSGRAGVVAEVVPADLAAVVGEPVGERLRLREQQHAHVLVGVAGEQHHVGGLEVFLAALEIDDAAHAAAAFVDRDAGHDRLRHHAEPPGGDRLGDGAHRGRVLGVDVAAAAVAEAVIEAARAVVVGLRVDRGRAGEGMPAEPARGGRHVLGELGAGERRHRIGARARALEDVAALVDGAADIAGLAGDADLVLDLVVEGLELLEPERPVLHRRALGDARGAVAARGFAHHPEVPRIEPPALRPVVQRGAADRVHHGMDGKARRIGRRRVGAMGGDLAVGLLRRLRPAAEIVAQLVGREIARRQPGAGLDADHVEARARERQRGDAADRAQPDDDDVGLLKVDGHGRLPW